MLSAQNSTFIIGPIAQLLGVIIDTIYNILSSIGIESVALSIVFFTIFVQILLIPLKYKSQKFTRLTALIQPEIKEIQQKYRGKRDQQSMAMQQQETREVYNRYGVSPVGGCLPMLVQMPILFALYAVVRNIPAYVNSVRGYYDQVATVLTNAQSVETLQQIKQVRGMTVGTDKQSIIDFLYNFNIADWNQLLDKIAEVPKAAVDKIIDISYVFKGVLVSDTPMELISKNSYLHWIWIIPILVYLSSLFSMKTAQSKNNAQVQGASQMRTMMIIMPIMSVVFSIILPVGLGIYWIMNSLLLGVQQILMNRYIDKTGIEAIIEKNVEKNQEKQQRQREKRGVTPNSIHTAAHMSTRSMASEESTTPAQSTPGTDSISSIARLTDKYKDE